MLNALIPTPKAESDTPRVLSTSRSPISATKESTSTASKDSSIPYGVWAFVGSVGAAIIVIAICVVARRGREGGSYNILSTGNQHSSP